jgi:hypothetical protein
MASPVTTFNASGNVANAVALALSATSASYTVDASTKFETQLQMDVLTGGAAQAAAVATLKVYRLFGAGPTSDTVPITQLQLALGAINTHYIASLSLSTGKYGITVTNGDTANAITFSLTSTSVDSIV